MPLDVELTEDFVTETIFNKGHEKDLEAQKTYISNLILGCIGFIANTSIDSSNVECSMEFENGNIYIVPREVVYDIHRIIGA